MQDPLVKNKLVKFCHAFVDQRIASATQAMEAAQAAANEEGKSSAGDKYETGRAMMQIERDKAAHQLGEALKLRQVLTQMDVAYVSNQVGLGSLIITRNLPIFIAIGIGKANVEGLDYLIVAPQSPLGKSLLNKTVKEEFVLNGEAERIAKIL